MKNFRKTILSLAIAAVLPLSASSIALAAENTDVIDIDSIESMEMDHTTSQRLNAQGWYVKNLDLDGVNRQAFVYIPEYAFGRAYLTIVTVPGTEDAISFLTGEGWTDIMDERGEILVGLVAGENGWGTAEEEAPYMAQAIRFANSGSNAARVGVFTTYGTDYLVGYADGSAPLEAWAAQNPTYISAQIFVNGTGAGQEILDAAGAVLYSGKGGGYEDSEEGIKALQADLAAYGFEASDTLKDIPVPTWFVGYAEDDYSISYWKEVNDVLPEADENGMFWQSAGSASLRTAFANSVSPEGEAHGISGVKVTAEVSGAREIMEFADDYTSYTQNYAYGNHVDARLLSYEARVAAHKAQVPASEENFVAYETPITADPSVKYDNYNVIERAESGVVYEGYNLVARERAASENGTFESGIFFAADDDEDGVMDAAEYLLYIPDSAKEADGPVPILFQFPGMLQSVTTGSDTTEWYRIGDETGMLVVIVGETYNNLNGAGVTWWHSDMEFAAICDILRTYVDGVDADIDWTRVYGSGHSLGSNQVQNFVRTHPDFFAAVASTSFASDLIGDYEAVPVMMLQGQSDLVELTGRLWENENLQKWFEYLAKANGLKVTAAAEDNADSVETVWRTTLWTWNNEAEIPMMVYGLTALRQHNCIPDEVPIMWDFLSRYSRQEDGTRLYSASAFAEDDAVVIE